MGYTAPQPKSGVYFTRNLTESNYNSGKNLLGYYWRESKISKPPYYPVTNFDGMIRWLDLNYPTFIESLGDNLKTIEYGDLIQVMKQVARKGYTDYPRPAYFSSALMQNAEFSFSDASKAVISGASEGLMQFGKGVWLLATLGVIAFILFEFREPIKKVIQGK